MTILNPTQLDEMCLATVNNASANPLLFAYLLFLYNTGCRPLEPLEHKCFIARNETDLVLKPLKNNNLRYIPLEDVPPSIFSPENANKSYLVAGQYDSLLSSFSRLKPKSLTTTTNKNTQLYLFRYNFVNQLFLDGKSYAEITTIMGWKNDSIVHRYLSTNIYIV